MRFELDFLGKKLEVEVNNWMERADGSVMVRYGDTVILGTIVVGKEDLLHLDYLPLMVEYEERFYAIGRIGGSRFIRRETRPSSEAILTARLIDRSLRPLFPKNLRREIQIVLMVVSLGEIDPDFCGLLAGSILTSLAKIPWKGPISGIRIAKIGENLKFLPTFEERKEAKIDAFISAKEGKIDMIEIKAKEAREEEIFEIFEKALLEIEKLNEFQKKILKAFEVKEEEKFLLSPSPEIEKETSLFLNEEKLEKTLFSKDPEAFSSLKESFFDFLSQKEFSEKDLSLASFIFEEKIRNFLTEKILKEKIRPDLRKPDEIRPLEMKVSLLPRVHGSALFCRGLTHTLSTVTLASPSSSLLVETIELIGEKRFIHHYNFLPFSSGEIGSLRKPPSRREIGHGSLVEKALEAVLPSEKDFPYTIRAVSEVLSSNGSTSMSSCSSTTLALADAGVPIKDYVTGVALGLVLKDENSYQILTDIQGPEDHYGLMDLKIAGTKNGITAVQMDLKTEGLNLKILKEAFFKAKEAREKILEKMREVLPQPRKEISPLAPKILSLIIPQNKIGLLIGPGGRTIQELIKKYELEAIDIQEDGTVYVTGYQPELVKKATEIISQLAREYHPGEVVLGKVVRILEYGALVELDQFHLGLLHISEISHRKIRKVSDVLKEGQRVKVKIIRVEPDGRLFLSMKALKRFH